MSIQPLPLPFDRRRFYALPATADGYAPPGAALAHEPPALAPHAALALLDDALATVARAYAVEVLLTDARELMLHWQGGAITQPEPRRRIRTIIPDGLLLVACAAPHTYAPTIRLDRAALLSPGALCTPEGAFCVQSVATLLLRVAAQVRFTRQPAHYAIYRRLPTALIPLTHLTGACLACGATSPSPQSHQRAAQVERLCELARAEANGARLVAVYPPSRQRHTRTRQRAAHVVHVVH